MDQPKSGHWLGIIVSIVGLLAIGATVVARFNTLENANELRVSQVTELRQRCDSLETRMLSMERNSEIRDRIAELRSDVAVLNEKVDGLSRRRGQ
jgi:hypothetical protein